MASLFKKKTVDGKFLAAALRACLFGQNRPATLSRQSSTGFVNTNTVNLFNTLNILRDIVWAIYGIRDIFDPLC